MNLTPHQLAGRVQSAAMLVHTMPWVTGITADAGVPGGTATYTINYAPGTTPSQQAQAAAVVATVDWAGATLSHDETADLFEYNLVQKAEFGGPFSFSLNNLLKAYPVLLVYGRWGLWGLVTGYLNDAISTGVLTGPQGASVLLIAPTTGDDFPGTGLTW